MGAFLRKYATATHIYIPLVKRGVVDFAVSADWTPAAGDVKVSIDGGTAANIGTLPTAISMGNTAMWDFTIASGEVTGKKIAITVSDSATKVVEDQMFVIETYGNASAEYVVDWTDGTRMGLTALPNANAAASGGLLTFGSGSGQVNPSSGKVPATLASTDVTGNVAADLQTIKTQTVTCAAGVAVNVNVGTTQPTNFTGTGASALVKTDMVDIAGAAVSTSTAQLGVNVVNFGGSAGTFASGIPSVNSSQLAGDSTAATNLKSEFNGTGYAYITDSGTAQAGSSSTITLKSGSSGTDDYYDHLMVRITGGSGSGQVRVINGYVGSTKVATVSPNWSVSPDGTSTYLILAAAEVHVKEVHAGAITASSFASGALDAAWDTVLSSHLTAGSTGAALNAAGAAGDPWTTDLSTYTIGQAGYLVYHNLDAQVSTRSSHSASDVWAVATRVLTAGTNIVLAKGTGVTGFNDLDAAGVRSAVGLASANLDTQIGTLATSSSLSGLITTVGVAGAGLTALPTAAQIATAVLTTQMTESYRATNASPTLAQAQFELIAHMGESSISGTTKTLKKLDGSTSAKTYTLNDATTPTAITETT